MSLHINLRTPELQSEFNGTKKPKPKKKRMAPLSVRMTKEQREQFERDAMGMTLNAYALSCFFEDHKPKRKNRKATKRDKAVAQALRLMGQCGVGGYLASQILAIEQGHSNLNKLEEMELRQAYADLNRIRQSLVEAMGLEADYSS